MEENARDIQNIQPRPFSLPLADVAAAEPRFDQVRALGVFGDELLPGPLPARFCDGERLLVQDLAL